MNIAYVSADFGVPIFGYKGASIHVREMITAWCAAGHTVCFFSPAIEQAHNEKIDDRAAAALTEKCQGRLLLRAVAPAEKHAQAVKELEALDKFWDMKTRLRQEVRNALYNLSLYEKALPHLQAFAPDFVYERYSLFGHAGIRLARELGVPHLLEVNAPLAYEQEKMRGLEMKERARESERRVFCGSDCVLAVSRQLQEYAVSCGVPEQRIHILPNAVDPLRFMVDEPGRKIRAHYRLEGRRVIGFVGSLKPWHGTATLLAAFGRMQASAPQAHLLIVGDGPERENLENFARQQPWREAVTFTGNVPYDEIPQFLAALDIAVAPYIPQENFYYSPIKIFEYMITGRAVVAGAIGQVREFVRDGETGLLYEPGNIEQLAAALLQLVADEQLCQRLGERAKAWVSRERTWANNAQQSVELAKALMKKHRHP